MNFPILAGSLFRSDFYGSLREYSTWVKTPCNHIYRRHLVFYFPQRLMHDATAKKKKNFIVKYLTMLTQQFLDCFNFLFN